MAEGLVGDAIELAGEVALTPTPGDRIRQARTRYGFTQTWLAPHLGVRRESLSRIESGHSNPTLDVVERFARVLTLAKHVRARTAQQEAQGTTPDPAMFDTDGATLGLDQETTRAVATRAIQAYDEKRQSLLEGIERTETSS